MAIVFCLPAQVRVMLAPSFSRDDVIAAAGQRECVCVSGVGSCCCFTCFCLSPNLFFPPNVERQAAEQWTSVVNK